MENSNYKLPIFESELKFYFSLLFISIKNYVLLTNNFGEEIDISNNKSILVDNKLINCFELIKWNNDKLKITDKMLLRIFNEEEILEYFNSYNNKTMNFNIDNPEDLESFYNYMIKEKVKEKKQIEFGTIFDLYDTFFDEEILNAVANLDIEDKKKFVNLFGIKGDKTFEINSDDKEKNDILIKLYIYMLSKRDEADIVSIIRDIIDKGDMEYDFYDFIRSLCKDSNLSKEFILEMFSKMDYNSKDIIKKVFGNNLEKKAKPKKEKEFKTAIQNLTVIIKINKEYRKSKQNNFNKKKKTGFDFEEKKKETDNKKENKEPKKEEKTDKKKVEVKVEKKEKPKKEEKKKVEKKIKKEVKEEKKKEDKKARLKAFLKENKLEEQDFKKATKLLDSISMELISLYYGLKEDPIDLDIIAEKLGKPYEDIIYMLDKAEKEIVKLIKDGIINKEDKKEEKSSNTLKEYVEKNNIKKDVLAKSILLLSPLEMVVVDLYLGVNNKSKSINQIAIDLASDEKKISKILDSCTDKLIANLEKSKEKEKKKEETKEIEIVDKKIEDKKEIKIDNKNKINLLEEFLFKNKISKSDFMKAYDTLDSYTKNIVNLYFGITLESLSIDKISQEYGKSKDFIEKIISKAKKDILIYKTPKKKYEFPKLSDVLQKNNLSKQEFMEEYKKLPTVKRSILNLYYGISTKAIPIDEIAKRYGKSESTIKMLIDSTIEDIARNSKTQTKEKNSRLKKFLLVNSISIENFNLALTLLSPTERKILYMYFGINCEEMNITEIAASLKMSPYDLKNDISDILKKINNISKTNGKTKEQDKNEILLTKINQVLGPLIFDLGFLSFVSGLSPVAVPILTMIGRGNMNINEISKKIGLPELEIINLLNSVSSLGQSYIENIKENHGFEDTEELNKKSERRY